MSISPDQEMIRDAAARFARERLLANAARLDRGEGADEYVANLRELAASGFNGIAVSPDWGGAGADSVSYALAIFEIAKACASTAVGVSINNMAAETIESVGTEAQKKKWLPPLMTGEFVAASFCLTEPGAGSDPAMMRTSAKLEGDFFLLNGAKQWITSGAIAGFYLVWAVSDPVAPKGKGISCLIVDRKTEGVSIGPDVQKMGQRGSPTNEVIFRDAKIPAENLLGELHGGFKIAMRELCGGRIGVAALALGIGRAAMEAARDYLPTREQHGAKLSEHQGLQWMLAERFTELEAAFWLIIHAARLKDAGSPFIRAASMAKLFATTAGEKATRDALQMFGGYGYMRDLPLERFCRDIRIASIYEGSSEIQKLIIARDLLREAGEGGS